MKSRENGEHRGNFSRALEGKRIPILTLDNKWYQLLTQEARSGVSDLEEQLNALLKQQGKLNNDVKDIKRLKKKLMEEIVTLVDDAGQDEDSESFQKIERNKKLVEECNERLEGYQDELLDLPRQIDELNYQLMLATMDSCYETMQENRKEIDEIARWVSEIRVELKKRLVRKQEMEQRNNAIYSYMHDVFGAEVIEIFDMQHGTEEQNSMS